MGYHTSSNTVMHLPMSHLPKSKHFTYVHQNTTIDVHRVLILYLNNFIFHVAGDIEQKEDWKDLIDLHTLYNLQMYCFFTLFTGLITCRRFMLLQLITSCLPSQTQTNPRGQNYIQYANPILLVRTPGPTNTVRAPFRDIGARSIQFWLIIRRFLS